MKELIMKFFTQKYNVFYHTMQQNGKDLLRKLFAKTNYWSHTPIIGLLKFLKSITAMVRKLHLLAFLLDKRVFKPLECLWHVALSYLKCTIDIRSFNLFLWHIWHLLQGECIPPFPTAKITICTIRF